MAGIDTKGMEVAPLDEGQFEILREAEKRMNRDAKSGEIYLLAVTRKA
ncbi:MAG: hypothetical protein K6T66_04305 [Peptococcaceae bacterium]|nr:hypothetical protein [Peptococcaceae bacterium]